MGTILVPFFNDFIKKLPFLVRLVRFVHPGGGLCGPDCRFGTFAGPHHANVVGVWGLGDRVPYKAERGCQLYGWSEGIS